MGTILQIINIQVVFFDKTPIFPFVGPYQQGSKQQASVADSRGAEKVHQGSSMVKSIRLRHVDCSKII